MNIRDRVIGQKKVPASSLRPSPHNWRTHPTQQRDALRGILAEVGFAGAELVRQCEDGTLELIDGHLRAEEMGDQLIPVTITDLTAGEAKKLLAVFDPIGDLAGADAEKLNQLLNEIELESPALLQMAEELAEKHGIGADVGDAGGGGDDFDATPEEGGATRTQPGDLWLIGGKHRLLIGSCTDAKNITQLFAGDVPLIMVTDPPYGVKYDPTWRHKAGINKSERTGSVSNDHVADWTDAWRLFPGNVAYVWHGALHGSTVFTSLESAGFQVRAQIVWAKPRLVLSRGHYHWKHEPMFVAERTDPEGESEEELSAEIGYYAVRKGGKSFWCGSRKETTLWEIGFSGESQTIHGTQKPIECMARPIRNHIIAGMAGAVYDPFLGSGTTLIAAHRLKRTCYGCELDPLYGDVILKRAEAEGMTVEKI